MAITEAHTTTPDPPDGLELGPKTFFEVACEISRADPGVGWSYEPAGGM